MNVEEAREFCLTFKNATESFPFDDTTLVFKVENKMFAVLPLAEEEGCVVVKCDPDHVENLREKYNAVEPAWHFNKKYWNSITLDSDMPDDEIKYWIRHSYAEVIAKLPKKVRVQYFGLAPRKKDV